MRWIIKTFEELNARELYHILQLRAEVFVVEQDCPYQDVDGKDEKSFHVCGYDGDALVAYARIVAPGISYSEMAIGRVVVKKTHRDQQLGYRLMEQCHSYIQNEIAAQPIRLSAQSHLRKFYERLGYQSTGKEYLEDGIPHTEMLRQ